MIHTGALLAFLLCLSQVSHAAAPRPNILFILTEDQGAHLGMRGTAGLQTPNMDALARTGVFFPNAFVAAKPVRLRFALEDAHVFAFQFLPPE